MLLGDRPIVIQLLIRILVVRLEFIFEGEGILKLKELFISKFLDASLQEETRKESILSVGWLVLPPDTGRIKSRAGRTD